ncbi:unnamed protein product [Blepharisma stoltei]|uniref:C2HC/C3H-type domain-containing protein n=1 Tax=Blepharisma stoltei TaxID=1481888 RepID=A0AAU9IY06_9CILI|nr:unnamed protein product [Blepharisma stoltei]
MEITTLAPSNSTENIFSLEDWVASCANCSQLLSQDEYEGHISHHCALTRRDSLSPIGSTETFTDFTPTNDLRDTCKFCHRKFLPDRISKHESACEFSSIKRPQFDMKRKRLPMLDFDNSKVLQNQKKITLTSKFNDKKWFKLHENFLNSIGYERKVKSFGEKGKDLNSLKPPSVLYDDYIQCPTCLRKFAPVSAERHIAICKNIINKPKQLMRVPSDLCLPTIKIRQKKHNKKINSLDASPLKDENFQGYFNFSLADTPNEFTVKKTSIPPVMRNSPELSGQCTIKTRRQDSFAFPIQCSHCSKIFDSKGLEKHVKDYSKELSKIKRFRVLSETPCPKYNPTNGQLKNAHLIKEASTLRLHRYEKGNAREEPCKNCKSICPISAKFCMNCGLKLGDE